MNKDTIDSYTLAHICGLPRHAPLPHSDNCFWFFLRLVGWKATFPIEFACSSGKDAQRLIADINCRCIEAAYVELREGGAGDIVYLVREIGGESTRKKAGVEFGQFELFRELSPKEQQVNAPPPGIAEPVSDQTNFGDLMRDIPKQDEQERQPGDRGE